MKQTIVSCLVLFFALDAVAAPAARSVFDTAAPATPVLRIERAGGARAGVTGETLAAPGESAVSGVAVGSSPTSAGLSSFLLPGLGQHRLGHTVRSRVYFALEGAAWIAVGSFLWQGWSREQAYRDYSVAFANVASADWDDEYYEMIASYRSSDGPGGYNEYIRREARDLYYPDADAMDAYYEANAIVGEQSWRWENETAFGRYRDLRDGSRSSYRRSLYAGIFAALLRVVSAVDAVRLAQGQADGGDSEPSSFSIGLDHHEGIFGLACERSF